MARCGAAIRDFVALGDELLACGRFVATLMRLMLSHELVRLAKQFSNVAAQTNKEFNQADPSRLVPLPIPLLPHPLPCAPHPQS